MWPLWSRNFFFAASLIPQCIPTGLNLIYEPRNFILTVFVLIFLHFLFFIPLFLIQNAVSKMYSSICPLRPKKLKFNCFCLQPSESRSQYLYQMVCEIYQISNSSNFYYLIQQNGRKSRKLYAVPNKETKPKIL